MLNIYIINIPTRKNYTTLNSILLYNFWKIKRNIYTYIYILFFNQKNKIFSGYKYIQQNKRCLKYYWIRLPKIAHSKSKDSRLWNMSRVTLKKIFKMEQRHLKKWFQVESLAKNSAKSGLQLKRLNFCKNVYFFLLFFVLCLNLSS